jgi:hypothetical protein
LLSEAMSCLRQGGGLTLMGQNGTESLVFAAE